MKEHRLLVHLNDVDDPRRPSNGTLHLLREILFIALCALLSDADDVEEIALWGNERQDWLRQYIELKHGVPKPITFLRVLRAIDPKQFETVFRRWMGGLLTELGSHIAIDGKTLRGSAQGDGKPIHMVSAFASDLGLVLGQEKVAAKSNEITAIPELLDALYLRGALVTIDAMGCQKDIADKIVARKGDYLLAVKGNQPSLQKSVVASVIDCADEMESYMHNEASHGRQVTQLYRVLPSAGIVDSALWAGCKSIGVVDSWRKVGGRAAQIERRYYISSRALNAQEFANGVRQHWGIENRLHWVLDVIFGEDASTISKDYSAQNMSLLKKMALNLIREYQERQIGKKKISLKNVRKSAGWNLGVLAEILGLQKL